MTRVLGLDIETTGLDHNQDHITEIAWVIKDVGDPKPLVIKSRFCAVPPGTVISDEIKSLTKITLEHLSHASPLETNVRHLCVDLDTYKVDYIVAHNGMNFDKPFLEAKVGTTTLLSKLLWLDTKEDCVYPPFCANTSLLYVAAYFGILNPFPHAALFDVMTMLKVLEQFDVEKVAARARHPWVVVQANVSYEARDLAKRRRYMWENIGTQSFPKKWVKKIKSCDLEREQSEAPFPVILVEVPLAG